MTDVDLFMTHKHTYTRTRILLCFSFEDLPIGIIPLIMDIRMNPLCC